MTNLTAKLANSTAKVPNSTANGTKSTAKVTNLIAKACTSVHKCCIFINFLYNVILMMLPVADDHQALIWDIQQMPRPIDVPILAYSADGEINQVQWPVSQPDWIAICYKNNLEILRV